MFNPKCKKKKDRATEMKKELIAGFQPGDNLFKDSKMTLFPLK